MTEEEKGSNFHTILICVSVSLVLCLVVFFPWLIQFLNIYKINNGEFGDQFGALNTLFTGLAFALLTGSTLMQSKELRLQRNELALQREEMARTRLAFEKSTELQSASLSGSLLLPIFQYTRTDCGSSLAILANQWRKAAKEILGEEEGANIASRLNAENATDELLKKFGEIEECLVQKFKAYKYNETNNKWGDDEKSRDDFLKWDSARRKISIVGQQVYQIKTSELVTSNDILKVSAFSDFVATYKYCCYPLDLCIERMRIPDAEFYPPGNTFIHLYTVAELQNAFY